MVCFNEKGTSPTPHKAKRPVQSQFGAKGFDEIVPLSAFAREQIDALKQWADRTGVRPASQDMQLVEELCHMTDRHSIGSLEVD
jgi:hypothetical protein